MPDLLEVLAEARRLGFLGPGPLEGHVGHARGMAAFAVELLGAPPSAWCDLGAGGGVPGLVLAEAWRGSVGVLLESSARRCAFLREASRALGLDEVVRVVEGRAEALARSADLEGGFELVVARSFAGPAATAECGARLLRAGGLLEISEPPEVEETAQRWPAAGLALLGLELASTASSPSFVALRAIAPCPDRFPRRVGVPHKRPLF